MTTDAPLPTRDPFTGDELIVTKLENPRTGGTFEGRFHLGWIGRLTPAQLDLVGLLLARRNNLQQLATDLGVSYNTIRGRFDDVVSALGGETSTQSRPPRADRRAILARLAAGQIDADEAEGLLRER